MSETVASPSMTVTAKALDAHRLVLEIQSASGVWQMPVDRAQATVLAKQLTELTQESVDPLIDLQRFFQNAMVKMPSGVLWMGAMPESQPTTDAMPRHKVEVEAFELSSVLLTQGLWRHVMGTNPSVDAGSKKPVHQISWLDAVNFCNRLSTILGVEPVYIIDDGQGQVSWNRDANGYRLPTEAEWEYAARTRDDLRFAGSDSIDKVGWVSNNVSSESAQMPNVGQKEPNLWGFHDMSGLVFEWCWDTHRPYSKAISADSKEFKDGEESSVDLKVCRGGSWKHDVQWAAVTSRFSHPAQYKGWVGLRLAKNSS